jgi:hypothetical protein
VEPLTVTVRFYDREDGSNPGNGSEVDSPDALLRIVDAHQARPPFFAEVVGTDFKLLVGLGGSRGCAQYSPANGDAPYLMAVGREPGRSGEMEFLIGGTATPVPGRYCLPAGLLRIVIQHFAETGKPSPAVEWEPL